MPESFEGSPSTIHETFSECAALHPTRAAITACDGHFTYAEIDARSDAVANGLLAQGIATGEVVALRFRRSAALIVAMLAVLKSGGAFTVLDAIHPQTRQALIVRDAACQFMLTDDRDAAAQHPDVVVLDLNSLEAFAGAHPVNAPVSAEYASYIVFTSGSTGRPKGVSVPHRAVVRLVVNNNFVSLSEDDVMLQLAPASFDASTFEIWGALLNGGHLVIEDGVYPTPDTIASAIVKSKITVAWLTAGLFHAVVDSGTAKLGDLRYLLAGGDVLSATHVNSFLKKNPNVTLVNGYGPTENTTFTTCHRFAEPESDDAMPIGTAIRHTSVYIVDDDLNVLPPGAIGEIVTSGLGLAHGYLGDAALTAEKFVPNPFAVLPGERLYRTGDLGRQRDSGALEFVGRMDNQVKIRGYRIEPREIETVLKEHYEVTDSAVVVQEIAGGRQLIACYVSADPLTSAELRWHIRQTLPEHMIPAAFVRFEALPLTSHGKVDRTALSATKRPGRPELSSIFVSPSSPTTLWLAHLWADLLEIEAVGVDDDFFEIGGHSLMAVRITSEISVEYDISIPPIEFYTHSTVRELAGFIDARIEERSASDVVEATQAI